MFTRWPRSWQGFWKGKRKREVGIMNRVRKNKMRGSQKKQAQTNPAKIRKNAKP